jgi:arylsulfatase A-like enzyme
MKKLVAFFLLLLGVSMTAQKKMNVLLVMIDDLNDMVGCLDGPMITPNLDEFAKNSVNFTETHCALPSCNPSRTAMFTGKRAEATKVYNNTIPFRSTSESKNLITLPQLLMENGYNTIAAGKIFHHNRKNKEQPDPQSDPVSWTYQWEVDSGLHFGKNFKKEFLDENRVPLWIRKGFGVPDNEARKSIKSTWSWGPTDVEPTNTLDFNVAEFGRDLLTNNMNDPKVAKAPNLDEKPFFLALGIFRPHIALIVPKQFFEVYNTKENIHRLELPNYPENDLDDLPSGAHAGKDWFIKYVKPYPEVHKSLRHAYFASATYADAALGVILEGLEKSGKKDNTIVIIMGDHGYQLGEKDRLGKAALWRGATRTPMLIKVPGKPAGVVNDPVSMIDIYPTLVDALNFKEPHSLAGESLLPLINNPKTKRTTPVVITTTNPKQSVGIVHGKWNYINYSNGDEELYNHENDPLEHHNLLHPSKTSKKYRKKADALKKFIPKNRT